MIYALYGTSDGFESEPEPVELNDGVWNPNSRRGYGLYSIGAFTRSEHPDVLVLSRDQTRPSTLSASTYANNTECGPKRSTVGMAAIYSVEGDSLNATPEFTFFGPYGGDRIQQALGDIDVNGDGYTDVVVGSPVEFRSRRVGCHSRAKPNE